MNACQQLTTAQPPAGIIESNKKVRFSRLSCVPRNKIGLQQALAPQTHAADEMDSVQADLLQPQPHKCLLLP